MSLTALDKKVLKEIHDQIERMVESIRGNKGNSLDPPEIPMLEDPLNRIARSVIDETKKAVGVTPRRALELGLGIGALGVSLSIGLGTALDLAQTKVAGSGLELRTLSSIVGGLIAPALTWGRIVYEALDKGIYRPVTWYFNSLFRTYLPDIYMLCRMYFEGQIDYSTLKDFLSYHGVSDYWVDKLLDVYDYNFSVMEALRLSELIDIPLDLLEENLYGLGLNERQVEIVKKAISYRIIRDERSKLVAELVNRYIRFEITYADLKLKLNALGYRYDEIEVIRQYCDQKRESILMDMRKDTLVYHLRYGNISPTLFQKALRKIGYDSLYANYLCELELARKGAMSEEFKAWLEAIG